MKLMKQMVLGAALLGVGLLGVAPQAQAISYTFQLNCVIGNGTCTGSTNYGFVKVEDTVANTVQVTVDTSATDATSKIQELALNTSGVVVTGSTAATFSPVANGINTVNIGPYCTPGGCFDVNVPATGNLGFTPQAFTLSGTGLSAASFLETAGAANLYVGVHIGSIGPNDRSIYVGGNLDPRTPPVPEPSTMILLGSGLLGLGIWRQKATK